MSIRKCAGIVLFLLTSILIAGASQEENGTKAIKTADGYLLVWNQPHIYFSLGIKGKDVQPLNSTEHVFFKVDGMALQVQTASISEFMKDAEQKKPADNAILLAHRDWESEFIANTLLGKKLDVKTVPQKLSNGSEALLWKFEMPKMPGMESAAREQLYLTVVSGDHVILLSGAVEGAITGDAAQKFLLETISTLQVSSKPIDVLQLQESIRKGKSQ